MPSEDLQGRISQGPEVEYVDPATLEPSEHHLRGETEVGDELVQSVASVGLINPPIGRWEGGELRLLDGLRRARAAEKAGVEQIPVVVKEVTDAGAIATALTLNGGVEAFDKPVVDSDRDVSIGKVQKLAGYETEEETRYNMGLLSDADRVGKAVDGAPGVGPATKDALAEKFETRERLEEATLGELLEVEGVGQKIALGIRRWLDTEDALHVV